MDPVLQLEHEWPSLARGALAKALPRWRRAEPLLARFESPASILCSLRRGSGGSGGADATLLALLRLAGRDRLAARLCLQAILPALKSQSLRLARGGAPREEVWELLLAYGWEAIRRYPCGRERRVAANLVLQVLHDTTRELRRRLPAAETGEELAALTRADARALAPPAAGGPCGVEGLVAAQLGRGAGERSDRELVLRTRVDGERLHRLAELQGSSYEALRKRRQRAEERLRVGLLRAEACPKRGRLGP